VGRSGGPWLAGLVLTTLALACAETVLPAVLGRAVDDAIRGRGGTFWIGVLGLLVAALVVCDALDDLVAGATVARSTAWLRHTAVRHVLALGPRALRRFGPGEVAGRVVGNTAEAGRVAPEVVRACTNLIPAVGGIVALALIDPWLCITFLAGMPVLLVVVRAFTRDASVYARRYLEVQGTIAGRLVDAIAGARTVAAAGRLDREAERILEPLPELHRHGVDMWRVEMRISVQDAVLVALLEIAVLAVAGWQLERGRITPGEMLAAAEYVLLAATLGAAVTALARLARARAGAGRLAEVLDEPPVPYGAEALPAGPGRVEFRGVTARVDGEQVLEGIDLVLPPGALVAVVGTTGAGKSLLGALAVRLVDPDEGDVLLDGVPLRRLGRRELREAVGYGFERPALLGESIAHAIAFGVHEPPEPALVAAARDACADGFIRRMPDGYRTRLPDAPMSGGEVQRIGLARTFAHVGRVVVLDDVAASLDTVTEHQISQVLTGALAGRTRLVVANRASTAARADVVVWLERRGIRAVGPHTALWGEQDYRALFEADEAAT